MKRTIALLVALLMLVTVSAVCEEQPSASVYTMAGFDSTEGRNWDSNAFFSRMQNITGVQFSFVQKSNVNDWHNYIESLKSADSPLPHVLFKANLYGYETVELYEQGVLVDLKPYLNTYCPNLCALLEQYPDVLDAITLHIDGKDVIPALPFINETPVNCGIWVNKNWLTAAGMKIEDITSVEMFETMLRKFKEIGDVPLGFLGSFDLKFLAHMWGMYANNYNMYLDENGVARFMPEDENFYPFIETMHCWYQEGLLDKDGYIKSDTTRQITSSSSKNPYGVIITTSVTNFLPAEWNKDYVMLAPIPYEGKVYYRDYFGHAITGTFALTSACTEEDIGILLGWVDFLYSPEGAVLASIGEKNSEYMVPDDSEDKMDVTAMLADGSYRWTLKNESSNNAMTDMRVNQLITGDATAPGYSGDAFQKLYSNNEIAFMFAQHEKLNSVASLPFPYYTLTREQLSRVSRLQNGEGTARGIGYTVDEQMALWILGEEELTEESYRTFIDTLYTMGLQEFKDFWQDVADASKQ